MRLRLCAMVGLVLVGILVFAGLRRGVSAAEERPPAIHDAEDPPADAGGLLVAVIDTGVDAGHAGFHGRCLPGISLAEPDQPATDLAGHGTAVAGLIAGSTDDRSVAGTAAGSVRILPIKVTSGAERQTLPTFLAAGIDRAVAEGAGVICIAMGSPRSTRGLDEAIERARSKGVLIVAAAGISDGSADYWPAMHPWVISCTVTEQREAEQPDGTRAFVEVPAARAHISGKTELMGSGFAQSLAPGGGTARLEGSSVVTARVAGYVAKLRTIRPDLEAAEVRRRVILSAAPVELGNFSLNFPVRRVHDGIAAAWGRTGQDLCLEAFDTNPGPVEPGKPAKMELLIANMGSAEQDGEALVEFPAAGVQVRAAVKALKPGESRRVELDLPAFKADSFLGRVSIRAEGDDNPANDALPVLLMVQPAPEVPVLVRHPRVIQLRYGEPDLVIAMEVQNCGPKQVRGSAGGAIGDVVTEQEITLDPRETKTIRTHMKIPVLAEGLTGVIPSVGFHVAGRPVHTLELPVNCVSPQATTQYADAWATKEIILDAPAFLVEGRVECPVLIFAPEAVSQDSQRKLSSSAAPFPGSSQRSRGLWLFEIHLEQAPFESVLKTDIVAGTPPSAMAGAKTLFHVRGRTEPPLLEGRTVESAGVGVESAVGMPVDPRDLVGFIREDGWHVVLNVPIASLANPADREIYLHAWVRSLDQALDPWKGGWTGFQSAVTIAEAVLRTQLHVSLPKFENSGQYYDLHVHTASEYTRDAVEPRLAWGGPLWMLVRSAHAMGFVDDAYLHAVRRQDLAAVGSREVLFTTDHNCFLTETVADPRTGARAEVKPAALPYGPELEIQTLRRFAGRGANQEVALQDPAGRPTGSAHALVYGVEPLRGPWHGGRRWQEGLGRAKVLLETLQAWRIPTFADRTLPGIIHWLLTQDASRGEVLGEINKALQKTGAPGITEEGFLGILRAWATFERGHLEELAALADGVISGAVARDERNDNTVPFVESQVAAHGAWIAAHPMAGGNLHWRIEDLDRAANLAGGPFVAIETAGRFPFSGVQIWNEEPFVEIPLGHPNELRQLNIWNRGIGTKQNFTNSHWHCEWMAGMVHYLNRLVLPGMSYTFQPRERRRRMFIRKLYHYAGSDAHGNFNYTTGVGATVLTNPDLAPLLAAFGQGHGSHTNTSHFGCARVYAQVPAFEEVYRGRVVCTDGPLAWIELDGDLKFDGASLIWHDRWDDPALAQDADGKIGGEGRFDGGRTALVRRDAAAAVLRYRVSERGPRSPRIERLDIHTLLASDDRASLELEPTAGALVPRPRTSWRPGDGQGWQGRALAPWALSGAGLLFVAGYSQWDEESDRRYDGKTRRCVTNPVWFTSVRIGASATPAVADGKAIVPPGKFIATFRADHAMLDAAPTVLLKQFNGEGDSVQATYRLVPTRSDTDGFWRPEVRDGAGGEFEADDTILIAVNEEPILLGLPWYPREGVDTFAVILSGTKDTHGNALNAVAAKIEIEWPVGLVPLPDEVSLPDPAPGQGAGEGLATLPVQPSETISVPKGATCGGKAIPPGSWSVPGTIPEAGIPLVVTCGTQTVTVLLVRATDPGPAAPSLARVRGGGFVGSVPAPGEGPAQVSIANHAERTIVVAEPAVVSGAGCVFTAPDLAPGACTATIRQGGKTAKHDLEAVAVVLRWDGPAATVGELRTLRLELTGAARPADWTVSGSLRIRDAGIVSLAAGVFRGADGSLTLQSVRGDAGMLLTARAVREGAMEAEYELAARRKP